MKRNQLTDVTIRAAVSRVRAAARRVVKAGTPGKPEKLTDGEGLYLWVTKSSARWRFAFQWRGEPQTLSLGRWAPARAPGDPSPTLPDEMTITLARERKDEARRLIAAGINPNDHREAMRAAKRTPEATTFGVIWTELFESKAPHWAPKHAEKVKQRYEKRLKPELADEPITKLENDADRIEAVLRPIWQQDPPAIDTSWRCLADISSVFKHAVATRRATRDPTRELIARKVLPRAPDDAHFAAVTNPQQLGELLRAISKYAGKGVSSTAVALRLLPHVFVRPGELRNMEWHEIEDLDGKEPLWRIPKSKMKMGMEHLCPLSRQAAEILEKWRPYSSKRLVFPSLTHGGRPISDGSMGAALRRCGYDNTMHVPHGFRSSASSMLNEMGVNGDLIELQLAHREPNKVRAAYNRSLRLDDRRKMMQQWSDRLDALQSATNVVALRRPA